ncbi:MAG: hypothetical protein WCA46_05230 [Actinocatenispora sp.]
MSRLFSWYGANPLHLLAMLGCVALAGYAAARLVPLAPLGVAVWFVGAVVGHDLVLLPLYAIADRSVVEVLRHRAGPVPALRWINHVRVPAALAGLLLLLWFPLILRLPTDFHARTGSSTASFGWHWLAVTGVLFVGSAVLLAVRIRRAGTHHEGPER